ncbi:MAG: DNA polymerase III subunit delta' [Candidatus Omnitrophica bacterium CG11_big_fil_rev_8_21_14_0_20_63_9]|nr:MAG: DNA polymerase III subunit delta' [Candidatus Omnitrophica bacterium CG11_big_fil_rev_8_21_14_0_20_63_9]
MAWSDVRGHELTKRVLQAQLAAGRVPNAYLFAGPEGIGKRRLALEMAKAMNCLSDGSRPCDACTTCKQFAREAHPDLHLVVPSGASEQIKIDDVRQVIGRVQLRPFNARLQVAVIDGADRLTDEAANSLLKVLEEPPAGARFLLTTSRLAFCLPTITSRCQILRCMPLSSPDVQSLLVEQGVDQATAASVAPLAGGSVKAAQELLERWEDRRRIASRLAGPPIAGWFEQPLPETRQDVAELLEEMTAWLRDLAVIGAAGPSHAAHRDHAETLVRQSRAIDVERCVQTAMELVELRESLQRYANPRVVASLAREKWLSLVGTS